MSHPLVATIGASARAGASRAGAEAAETALKRMAPCPPTLALMFGSSWFDQASLLAGARATLGELPLVGASTAGEIISDGPLSHSCVVVLLHSESLACGLGFGEAVDRAPREAGQRAAYAAVQELRGIPRAGLLLFGDGLLTNYADVLRGFQEVLGTNTLIAGGMAGDDLRFSQTFQYYRDRALTRSVVGALLGGGVKIGVGMEHGFTPISKPHRITRAWANVIAELDRQPAASVYEEYFGAELAQRMAQERLARHGIAYPLGLQSDIQDQWLLRNVIAREADGSLLCTGEVREGAWLQLMIGSRELALEAARQAARRAVQPLNRVAVALVFDSVVRRKFLGPRDAAEDIARIRQVLGADVPLAGCYTYGEQAPLDPAGRYEPSATQTGSVLVIALGT